MNIAYYVCAEIRFLLSATVVHRVKREREAAEGRERVCVSEHAQRRTDRPASVQSKPNQKHGGGVVL